MKFKQMFIGLVSVIPVEPVFWAGIVTEWLWLGSVVVEIRLPLPDAGSTELESVDDVPNRLERLWLWEPPPPEVTV